MLTIRDLIEQIEVQGTVSVRQITNDDVVKVYKSPEYGGLHECKALEPYLDKEIKYIYSEKNAIDDVLLVIEVE